VFVIAAVILRGLAARQVLVLFLLILLLFQLLRQELVVLPHLGRAVALMRGQILRGTASASTFGPALVQ
jgi:hypothetical protein